MSLPRFPLACHGAALALALVWLPPAAAQTDPAALSLIEQLRPRAGGATRGIRLPAAAPTETRPEATRPASPPPRVAAVPRAAESATTPPTTTAPEGVAAVSITVTFPSGSAVLTPQAEARLAPLGRALSSPELAPYRFRIEGHTDSTGDAEMNQALSERRAAAVRAFLTERFGVSGTRLEVVGLGESRLLVPTGDGVNEPRNRRVQVINLDS
ncbi:OmpA family protein [Falsiroseomonas selenitidurans]|uniref:OmpA family protein n=1 Tax=Falsiroseomonas selenitidurans TaxID=2716335 RepID=A0ABX1EBA4_9PROT|nr:OmpA family protein [Falsiroseomonas selenitidurans]NKC34095.1 OmpA family protein [Falsiroseomonas selenitidurans]